MKFPSYAIEEASFYPAMLPAATRGSIDYIPANALFSLGHSSGRQAPGNLPGSAHHAVQISSSPQPLQLTVPSSQLITTSTVNSDLCAAQTPSIIIATAGDLAQLTASSVRRPIAIHPQQVFSNQRLCRIILATPHNLVWPRHHWSYAVDSRINWNPVPKFPAPNFAKQPEVLFRPIIHRPLLQFPAPTLQQRPLVSSVHLEIIDGHPVRIGVNTSTTASSAKELSHPCEVPLEKKIKLEASSSSSSHLEEEVILQSLEEGRADFPIGALPVSSSKPPYSYSALVAMAITSTSKQIATTSEICNYISATFPYYKKTDKAWKCFVRHALSQSSFFMKVPFKQKRPRVTQWMINPESRRTFLKGSFQNSKHRSLNRQGACQPLLVTSAEKASMGTLNVISECEHCIRSIPNTSTSILELIPSISKKTQKVYITPDKQKLVCRGVLGPVAGSTGSQLMNIPYHRLWQTPATGQGAGLSDLHMGSQDSLAANYHGMPNQVSASYHGMQEQQQVFVGYQSDQDLTLSIMKIIR